MKKGRYFKKRSAPIIKKYKKEDEAILVLRSWNVKIINLINSIKKRKWLG